MGDAPITHVGDVKQTVYSAEVDERSEVSDILHGTGAYLAYFQLLH